MLPPLASGRLLYLGPHAERAPTAPAERREPRVVQGAALLTIFVTIATMIGLWFVPAPAALR
jgi:hypothetical protein